MYDDDIREDQVTALTRENQELKQRVDQLALQAQQRDHAVFQVQQQPERSLIEFPSSSIVGDWHQANGERSLICCPRYFLTAN